MIDDCSYNYLLSFFQFYCVFRLGRCRKIVLWGTSPISEVFIPV